MTLPEAFGKYIRASATAALAHYGASKLFWCYETQNTTAPFMAFRLSSTRRMAVDTVRANQPREYTIEVNHFASSQSAAWDGAVALASDLDNFAGAMEEITVKRCYVVDEADMVSEEAASRGLFAVSQTFQIIA